MAGVGGRQVEILVSDLAGGLLLSTHLSQRPGKRLIPFEALHLIHSLALGVDQIHFLGQYHGDIHTDNTMVSTRDLESEVHLIGFLDLGRSTREKIQIDVFGLMGVLHELVGSPGLQRVRGGNPQTGFGSKARLDIREVQNHRATPAGDKEC